MLLDDQRPAPAREDAAETAGAAQEPEDASWIIKDEFPNGLRPERVQSEGRELCGIHAIIDSFRQLHGHKRPTRRELMNTLQSNDYRCNWDALDEDPIESFFPVDALSLLFHCWARAHSNGRRYTLVICNPDGSEVHRAVQDGGTDGAQQTTLYIGHQRFEGNDGHYFALVPVTDREAARAATRRDTAAKDRERKASKSKDKIPGNKTLVGAWEKEVLDEHAEIPMIKVSAAPAMEQRSDRLLTVHHTLAGRLWSGSEDQAQQAQVCTGPGGTSSLLLRRTDEFAWQHVLPQCSRNRQTRLADPRKSNPPPQHSSSLARRKNKLTREEPPKTGELCQGLGVHRRAHERTRARDGHGAGGQLQRQH